MSTPSLVSHATLTAFGRTSEQISALNRKGDDHKEALQSWISTYRIATFGKSRIAQSMEIDINSIDPYHNLFYSYYKSSIYNSIIALKSANKTKVY